MASDVEELREPTGALLTRSGGGAARVWLDAPRVVAAIFEGHPTPALVQPLIAEVTRLAQGGKVDLFADLWDAHAWDAAFQRALSDGLSSGRTSIGHVHVLVRNGLTATSPEVDLGELVVAHTSRPSFEQAHESLIGDDELEH